MSARTPQTAGQGSLTALRCVFGGLPLHFDELPEDQSKAALDAFLGQRQELRISTGGGGTECWLLIGKRQLLRVSTDQLRMEGGAIVWEHRFATAHDNSSVGRLTIRGLSQESSLPFLLERIAAQGLVTRYPDR